jgi:hypothetical protein
MANYTWNTPHFSHGSIPLTILYDDSLALVARVAIARVEYSYSYREVIALETYPTIFVMEV